MFFLSQMEAIVKPITSRKYKIYSHFKMDRKLEETAKTTFGAGILQREITSP